MKRQADVLGIVGVGLLVLGVWIFMSSSVENANWMGWLGGIALWFAGFACIIGWLTSRWSGRVHGAEKPPR
jgi:hypothetical protein